jgi:hypothetical protein
MPAGASPQHQTRSPPVSCPVGRNPQLRSTPSLAEPGIQQGASRRSQLVRFAGQAAVAGQESGERQPARCW